MKLKTPFRVLGKLRLEDLAFFKNSIGMATISDWMDDTSRQDTWEAHRQTQSIVLVKGSDLSNRKVSNQWDCFWKNEFEVRIVPLLKATYGPGVIVRCVFSKLLPMSKISEHRDTEHLLHFSHRVHIPIITSPKVQFNIRDEVACMEEGQVYEISNQDLHSVTSEWDHPRVHIILDYAEDRFKDILMAD